MEQSVSSFTASAPLLAIVLGVVGLGIALAIYRYITRQPAGSSTMVEIADAIHDGAMVFLRKEYQILAVFITVVFLLLIVFIARQTAIAFLCGAATRPKVKIRVRVIKIKLSGEENKSK